MIVPYSEQLLEQLEWIAEDIVQRSGDAYVLPVTELAEAEEELIRHRMSEERHDEFGELREAAEALAKRLAKVDPHALEPLERFQFERELAALQRRFTNAVGHDHFASSQRSHAIHAIELAASAFVQAGPLGNAAPATRRVRPRPRTGRGSLRR